MDWDPIGGFFYDFLVEQYNRKGLRRSEGNEWESFIDKLFIETGQRIPLKIVVGDGLW